VQLPEAPPALPAAEALQLDDEPFPVEDAVVLEVEIAPAQPEDVAPPAVAVAVAVAVAAQPPEPEPEEVDISDVEEIEAEVQVEPPAEPPLVTSAPPPPPLPERSLPPLDAELEEVEFYERQGLLEEALLAVRELDANHPGHPEVERVRARIEGLARLEPEGGFPAEATAEEGSADGAAPPAEPPEPGPPGPYASTGTTGIFDLGAELSAELGPELTPTPTGEFQYSVADVFDQFKRGLERTVRPDDSATKYDLGIAFQEMGMLDEALEQFRSALAGGDRRREVEILNMIGVCLGMKGAHRDAVDTYRQALRSEFLTGDGAKAIHFELGAAHEALGEPDAALWYFQKIAHVDPAYRGAGERVAHLGGGPGTAPDGGGHPARVSDAGGAGSDASEPPHRPARKNAGTR
jgi:tetratricopeptide (TPR) repeat protein